MSRTLKPVRAISFSGVPTRRSRVMSSFVAIAAERLGNTTPRWARYGPVIAGILLLIVGVASNLELRWLIGFAGLVLVAQPFVAPSVSLAVMPEQQRKRFVSARLMQRLNHVRASIGLDEAIDPAVLEGLEAAAGIWERIDNLLAAKHWHGLPDLKARIDQAAFDKMVEIITMSLGGAAALGISESDALSIRKASFVELARLFEAADAASSVVLSYSRPNDQAAGAPLGDAFEEIRELEALLA